MDGPSAEIAILQVRTPGGAARECLSVQGDFVYRPRVLELSADRCRLYGLHCVRFLSTLE